MQMTSENKVMQDRLKEIQLKKKQQEYIEHQILNEQDIAKASRDIMAEQMLEKEKKQFYDQELKKMVQERKQQKRLDAM